MDRWLETRQLQVHLVSAAGVVYRDGRVLLIRTARRGWEYPGGVVEQGESILDGLRREIQEESGITAEPECLTGIYQNLEKKSGYGPLEGIILPTTVNLVFRCRYVSGKESVSDESLETGWFTPEEAMRMITQPHFRKAFRDALEYSGTQHFGTFRKKDRSVEFISDRELASAGSADGAAASAGDSH